MDPGWTPVGSAFMRGRMVGQWQVAGALKVMPRLVPTESPVSPHHMSMHALCHLGPLQRIPILGAHFVPLVAWSQALCTFSLGSCMLWVAHRNSQVNMHGPSGSLDQALCVLVFPCVPCTLGSWGEFLDLHPPGSSLVARIRHPLPVLSATALLLWAVMGNSPVGTC